jgi:hypothetical protein
MPGLDIFQQLSDRTIFYLTIWLEVAAGLLPIVHYIFHESHPVQSTTKKTLDRSEKKSLVWWGHKEDGSFVS